MSQPEKAHPPQEQEQEAQVSETINAEAAYELANAWIAGEIDGGAVLNEPEEFEGRWYFVPTKGGTSTADILLETPEVYVDLSTGDVGWDEEIGDGLPDVPEEGTRAIDG